MSFYADFRKSQQFHGRVSKLIFGMVGFGMVIIFLMTVCPATGITRHRAEESAKDFADRANLAGGDVQYLQCTDYDSDGDMYVSCTFLDHGQTLTMECSYLGHGCRMPKIQINTLNHNTQIWRY